MKLKVSSRMGSKYVFKTFTIELPEVREAFSEGYYRGNSAQVSSDVSKYEIMVYNKAGGTITLRLRKEATGVDKLLHLGKEKGSIKLKPRR